MTFATVLIRDETNAAGISLFDQPPLTCVSCAPIV
jgi:hypothetical protein